MGTVEIDDPATWPSRAATWIGRVQAELQAGTISSAGVFFAEREAEFRALFAGHWLRALHCTRVLDHEVESIRSQGLRPLTRELVESRIARAFRAGEIGEDERACLERTHVFALGCQANREDQVCLIVGRSALDVAADGCEPLLRTWGGEGIYWHSTSTDQPTFLTMGAPAIVVTMIDPSLDYETLKFSAEADALLTSSCDRAFRLNALRQFGSRATQSTTVTQGCPARSSEHFRPLFADSVPGVPPAAGGRIAGNAGADRQVPENSPQTSNFLVVGPPNRAQPWVVSNR